MRDIQLMRQVVAENPLAAYAELGARDLNARGSEARGPCPLHHGDNDTAFVLRLTGERAGSWYCFTGCGAGGDVFDFAGRSCFGAAWDKHDPAMFREALEAVVEAVTP